MADRSATRSLSVITPTLTTRCMVATICSCGMSAPVAYAANHALSAATSLGWSLPFSEIGSEIASSSRQASVAFSRLAAGVFVPRPS
jgi:hypothetical protein